jgi:hypothetical protein
VTPARRRRQPVPFRLGFAVKVLGQPGRKALEPRRRHSEPHLSRSLELLAAVFDYLHRIDIGRGYDDRVAARSCWADGYECPCETARRRVVVADDETVRRPPPGRRACGRLGQVGAGRAARVVPALLDHSADFVTPLNLPALLGGATRPVGRAEERAADGTA